MGLPETMDSTLIESEDFFTKECSKKNNVIVHNNHNINEKASLLLKDGSNNTLQTNNNTTFGINGEASTTNFGGHISRVKFAAYDTIVLASINTSSRNSFRK